MTEKEFHTEKEFYKVNGKTIYIVVRSYFAGARELLQAFFDENVAREYASKAIKFNETTKSHIGIETVILAGQFVEERK